MLCDDRRAAIGQGVDTLAHDGYVGMFQQRALDLRREDITIHRHGRSGGNAGFFAGHHDKAVQPPHFVMQQADRVPVAIVRAEAVGADQLGQSVGLVGGGHVARAAHFGQADAETPLRQLPGRFASGEPAADDVDIVSHHGARYAKRGALST